LQETHAELLYFNQNLEAIIAERTEALALSERKYRRMFEVSRDMIVVTEIDGTIVDMNPAGCEMMGLQSEAVSFAKAHFRNFFDAAADWNTIAATVGASGFVSNFETILKDANGRAIRVLVSGSVDRGLSEREETVHFWVKDIENRLRIEEQIAQADKLASIGQLSAGIAHEINNPLGVILGYTQLLIRQSETASETYQDLKTIEKHVRNCKTVVEDLLNFARTSPPQEDAIRIDAAVDDVLNFVRQHAGLERVRIDRSYDPRVPEMVLDAKKIKQVFMNLIMNARHAIGDSGMLTVATVYNHSRREVEIRVSDTGHGIEPKNLPRIFDPFFTTKPTGEGTGLGLSVSYGIVKNHGGEIHVSSTVGEGSCFTVILPVVSPPLTA
jgi:PAS domain S-box-containing protein